MANVIVVGGQWGDEGKGKVVDLLTEHVDICARFGGGHNAGHTVTLGDVRHPLHLVPCGILRPNVTCVIGNGVVVEPATLLAEIDGLVRQGIEVEGRLLVSDRAHVVLPHHPAIDRAREDDRSHEPLGTTSRGIGPTYADKHARVGLRVADLFGSDARSKLEAALAYGNELMARLWSAPPLDVAGTVERFLGPGGHRDALEPHVTDTVGYLNRRLDEGASLLLEGAQGTLLDIDHGTYPFVTSSSCTAGGACTGAGIAPTRIDAVLGVFKAYTTRVGAGPFPTELTDGLGDAIRRRGNEYGTTTGRPRRCGWFDAVGARHAVRINGIEAIALTLLDVLDDFAEVEVCVGYRHRGTVRAEFPADLRILRECEPVYRTMRGWRTSLSGLTSLGDFPQAAQDYLSLLRDLLQVEIALVSTGPERRRTIIDDRCAFWRLLKG